MGVDLGSAPVPGRNPEGAQGRAPSPLERLIRHATAHSLWPIMLGLDYATLELYSAIGPHYDLARLGSEVLRPSPRQTDVLIVSGAVTRKMAPVIQTLYEALAEPRFVIALGSGAVSGAPWQGSYNVLPGIEGLVPVDLWVPGDPPRPAAVLAAIRALRARILDGTAPNASASETSAGLPRYAPSRWPRLHEAMVLGETEEGR